eukprot:2537367-Rhodomonas_salina.1
MPAVAYDRTRPAPPIRAKMRERGGRGRGEEEVAGGGEVACHVAEVVETAGLEVGERTEGCQKEHHEGGKEGCAAREGWGRGEGEEEAQGGDVEGEECEAPTLLTTASSLSLSFPSPLS